MGMQSAESQIPQEPEQTSPTRTRLDDLRVFRPEFYAAFHPRTALDMVLKTPGFQLDVGSGGRGLEGAAGNVLINGVRPPAKAAPVTEALSDIPADEVVAIILVPAGTMDIDMAAHPLLINVIRAAKAGVKWGATLQSINLGSQGASMQASGDARWTGGRRVISINAQQSVGQTSTRSSLAAPIAGQTTARETSGTQSDTDDKQLSTTGQWDLLRGDQVQLRLNLSQLNAKARPVPGSSEDALRASSDAGERSQELAGEWQAPLKDDAFLALTALYTRRQNEGWSLLEIAGTKSASSSISTTGETALRAELRGHLAPQLTYKLGGDHASNFLEGNFSYSVNDEAIEVPGSASAVSEQRVGVFGSTSWTPNTAWTSEASLRWERSKLRNATDNASGYAFGDWLPRLTTAWTPITGHKVQAKLERVVGQLAFSQFLAAVQLQDQIITVGADTLQPERSWMYGVDYEYRFGERGLFNAGLERERIDNPIDSVPAGDQSERSTNVGAATVDKLKLDFTAPLDKVGLPGGLLTAHAGQAVSSTRDPVTGQPRSVSGISPALSASLSLRQNLSHGAWGLSATNASESTLYGVRQVMQVHQSPTGSLFGEWRPHASLAARLTLAAPSQTISETVLYASARSSTQQPNLIYLSSTRRQPAWQARLEWEPRDQALFDLVLMPRSQTIVVGQTMTGSPGSSPDVQRSILEANPSVSAQLKLRW